MRYFICLLLLSYFSLAQKKQALFNGKNLDGWTVHGTETWFVENGLLYCESGPDKGYGYLMCRDKFKNFELILKFKPESNGNSGVFFHCDFADQKISGWQAEVAPPGHFSGGIYESYKRGWLIKPDPKLDNIKMNEWNTMKLKVVDNTVETWVNKKKMISLTDSAIGEIDGKIALQIHDGGGIKIVWKDILVKRL
jgi:hypothetical protein